MNKLINYLLHYLSIFTLQASSPVFESIVKPNPLIVKGEPAFIVDSQMRIYQAKYISHTVSIEDGVKVYRVLFQVKLHEQQLPIKR